MIVAAGAVSVERCCQDAAAAAAGPDSAAVVSMPSAAVDLSSSAAVAAGTAAVDVDDIASVVVASLHCCQWLLGTDAAVSLARSPAQPSNITTTAVPNGDSCYLTEYKHLAFSTDEFKFE